MKYIVFAMAVIGVPPLAWLLSLNARWMRHAFWGMALALCLYQSTAINFFSNEFYRGTSRGMETSLVHLLCATILLALAMRRRVRSWLPGTGFRLYALYFLLCLPSFWTVESALVGWFEVWKMILLPLVGLAVFGYLDATDDIETPIRALALLVIANAVWVLRAHFLHIYQPAGLFPHRNSMAMAMQLVGPVFLAAWLEFGVKRRFGRLCVVAFLCAAFATVRSYSRGAIALAPIGYGVTALCCLSERIGSKRKFRRMVPVVVLGMIGASIIAPRIVERFENAPASSKDTRVQLAACAREMILDEPWRGVGLNNWGIKINPPYDYAERAGRVTGRGEDYADGIVETVYLLVAAECGIPALCAMLLWFGWYFFTCVGLMRRTRGTMWHFLPAGLVGGLFANYAQSALEWVLRQPINMILLMFLFGMVSWLDVRTRKRADLGGSGGFEKAPDAVEAGVAE